MKGKFQSSQYKDGVLQLMDTYNALAQQVSRHALVIIRYNRYTLRDRILMFVVMPAVFLLIAGLFVSNAMRWAIGSFWGAAILALLLSAALDGIIYYLFIVGNNEGAYLPLNDRKAAEHLRRMIVTFRDILDRAATEQQRLAPWLEMFKEAKQLIEKQRMGSCIIYERVHSDWVDFFAAVNFENEWDFHRYEIGRESYELLQSKMKAIQQLRNAFS